MKLANPKQIALFISLCLALIALCTLGLFATLIDISLPLWGWLTFVLICFAASFVLTWWSIEKFIYEKIKTLYASINSPDALASKIKDASKSRDVLGVVQKDVEEWATGKQSEIQSLKEQAKFRRDFVGNLAHELRTPIFNIQGYLLTLLEGGLEDPKINYDYLTRADNNLERLITLVEDLDNITQLESGRQALKFEKFNAIDLIHDVFGLMELKAADKNIALRFNKKYEKPIMVKADRDKLVQVVSNLVLNAINYGKYDGYCEVRFIDMPEHVLIEVADDGIGVSAEDLPRLFERFYRADKSRARNQGGTGLGLAIVKHIIESHGQSINVRSTLDKGSTFSFTLEKAK